MSPILKRDISEQYRHAKRLASATLGSSSNNDNQYDTYQRIDDSIGEASSRSNKEEGYSNSSSARQGIGVDRGEVESAFPIWKGSTTSTSLAGGWKGKGKSKAVGGEGDEMRRIGAAEEYELDSQLDGDEGYIRRLDSISTDRPIRARLNFAEPEMEDGAGSGKGIGTGMGKRRDLRSLLLESTPSLLLSLIGLVFTGELLEHLARWRVFRRVDELFILVPMIGNLKGNLEMCLSARLGTSANIGELDHKPTRKKMILANLTLLGLQALLISCLAAVISFFLGWITIHRLGDSPSSGDNTTSIIPPPQPEPEDPGLSMAGEEWHEGYTRPGFKQLLMVLATGMGAAGISSAVLGSFMGSLIVLARWCGADPDNITPPVAACLGDLLTLFILALLGTALVGAMDTVIPLLAVIIMSIAAGWFTRRVMRNEWVKNVAKGGWVPLIGAMLISSGTGMVLAKGVGKYRGFALLAISMTGLTGSIGAIHANRLSTSLHTLLHPKPHSELSSTSSSSSSSQHKLNNHGLTPFQSAMTLYLIAFPCQAAFLGFVSWAGWIDVHLGLAGWACYALTTGISLVLAHWMTLFFWSKDLDPDSYTLPIHSALVDFLGQLLLMLAYEICIWQGKDVVIHDRLD
ncbi:hypothetical protein I302_100313 [Kwoniella bestiolae CBS 10118]|uniref:Solute carrier family 41 n=1 Tax=Kwoniella bestiolae CBS 10118 TaxID=1296100 RepID=A0A1B9G4T3_9TREE|nr:solute carrier family 41 [Kwoniella bestiolae CBS 10118]OCF26008.1 solute carrier family 41 [Kwoniella bestiolae CBS 10118]